MMRKKFTSHLNIKMKMLQVSAFVIAFLLINLFFLKPLSAQVTQMVAWTKGYDGNAGTTNFNFSIPAGANRILVVGVTASITSSTSYSVTSLSYGGQNLASATSNLGSSGHAHTALYYLKDNPVMDGTAKSLIVTLNSIPTNMTVWYSVFSGVDQSPSSYTGANGFANPNGGGTLAAALSPAITINSAEQGIYISSIQNTESTSTPVYTTNANWTSMGSNTGNNIEYWKNEVANRTSTPNSTIIDNASTSTVSPNGDIRFAMSAISLPKFPCPTISASATKNDVKCFNTSTGEIVVSGSGGTSPYTFSIDNGINYNLTLISGGAYEGINATSGKFKNLPVGTYQIRVKDANGCESKPVQ